MIVSAEQFLLPIVLLLMNNRLCVVSTNRSITIDFNVSLTFANVHFSDHLEVVCPNGCRWIIPIRMKPYIVAQQNKIVLDIVSNSVRGNLTACESEGDSQIEYHNVPFCCPCCTWFELSAFKTLGNRIQNCSTISIFIWAPAPQSVKSNRLDENAFFSVPCQMRRGNLEDKLEIVDIDGISHMKIENGKIEKIGTNMSYFPMVGLCVNSSQEKLSPFFQCRWNSTITVDFWYTKISARYSLNNYLILPNGMILKADILKILDNESFVVYCNSTYWPPIKPFALCRKFFIPGLTNSSYNCMEVSSETQQNLTIDGNKIESGMRIICHSSDLVRNTFQTTEITIQKYTSKSLAIRKHEEQVVKVYSNQENAMLSVSFDSVPTHRQVQCQIEPSNVALEKHLKWSDECVLTLNTLYVLKMKRDLIITVTISDQNESESENIILKPIYLEIPSLVGFTSTIESNKDVECLISASKPYNVSWIMGDRIHKRQYNNSGSKFSIAVAEMSRTLCGYCEIENELGCRKSEEVCQDLLDVDIPNNKILQIFLVDAIVWMNNSIKQLNISLFDNGQSVKVLDAYTLHILCASRKRDSPINIFFKNKIVTDGIKETQTFYTRQLVLTINVSRLSKYDFPGIYHCEQTGSGQIPYLDATSSIEIVQTYQPQIYSKENADKSKLKFIYGQNIHFDIYVISFPPATFEVFKNTSGKFVKMKKINITIDQTTSNKTYVNVKVWFNNITNADEGRYFITANNVKGCGKFSFSLESVKFDSFYVKVYWIVGAIGGTLLIIVALSASYCHKSGYTVPIIQIQNSLYKSLDMDSMNLLNNIWPDPLDRSKWTIKQNFQLRKLRRIGGGNYGIVYLGILKRFDSEELVALKQPLLTSPALNDNVNGPQKLNQMGIDCFVNEARILAKLQNCPNVIKLFGCVMFRDGIEMGYFLKEATTLLVLEYCNNRSLMEFLQKHSALFDPYIKYRKLIMPNGYTGMKVDEGLTLLDLKKISEGIATGLDYMNGLGIIHRDLASRNILIDERKIPKISDFGLAVELESAESYSSSYQILSFNKPLPYKIIAPEALESKTFYLESDVWSFGLLLWQIFNLERDPLFPHINGPEELLKFLYSRFNSADNHDIVSIPQYADGPIWNLIKSCLTFNPSTRPTTHDIRSTLIDIIRKSPIEIIRVNSYVSACSNSVDSSKMPLTSTSSLTLSYSSNSPKNSYATDSMKLQGYKEVVSESLM